MKQILRGHLEERFTTIMMLYKNTKEMVRSFDGGSDFFHEDAGVFQVETLVLNSFILFLKYVVRTSIDLIKENTVTLKKQEADDILQKI